MSFNTPRGDTSPRDMAEKCLWIGYELYGLRGVWLLGVQDGNRSPWPRCSEPARQYSSTVTSHREGSGSPWGQCLETDRKQFDE